MHKKNKNGLLYYNLLEIEKIKNLKIAQYWSQREIHTVASREAPMGHGLKSHPKDYHEKLTY